MSLELDLKHTGSRGTADHQAKLDPLLDILLPADHLLQKQSRQQWSIQVATGIGQPRAVYSVVQFEVKEGMER